MKTGMLRSPRGPDHEGAGTSQPAAGFPRGSMSLPMSCYLLFTRALGSVGTTAMSTLDLEMEGLSTR